MINDNHSDVDSYMRHIKILDDGLGPDREKQLSRIIKCSNNKDNKNKAIDELVNGNLGLVIKCAKEVFSNYHSSLSMMDLIAEGNYWLFYCARHFSYKKNCRFSTYAYPIIKWHIKEIVSFTGLIRVPSNVLSYRKKIYELTQKYKGKITDDILVRELDISRDRAETIMCALGLKISSLDGAIGEDKDRLLKDTIKDEMALDPSLETDKTNLREYLNKVCNKCLSEKEKKVIELCFYTNGQVTLDWMASKIGVTRERTRQILARAIKKIRKAFFDEWDKNHKEDRIDNEEIYKEVNGEYGYCYNYRMRNDISGKFWSKLNEVNNNKGKKIFQHLM